MCLFIYVDREDWFRGRGLSRGNALLGLLFQPEVNGRIEYVSTYMCLCRRVNNYVLVVGVLPFYVELSGFR